MRDIREEVGFLSDTMSGLGALGRTMTFAFTVPVLTLGTYAVQAASEFEGAMRNVNSIAQLTEVEFQELSAQVLEFGKHTRAGATEAAGALYTAFSAGITDTATAMQFMEVASHTSEAGLANLTTTTEALIASFLAFGGANLPVAEQLELVEHHSNALTQMVQVGVGDMEAFASSLGAVVPSATALNVGIEDLYGTMAFLTQRSLNARTAAVSLNAAFASMQKPSNAMEAAFAELGVTTGDELVDKFGGLEEAMVALFETTDGTSTQLNQLFQSRQASRAASLLSQDIEGWQDALSEFDAGLDGATDRARAEQIKSFAAQWDFMTSALQGAGIAIGNVLMPALVPLVQAVTDFLNGISEVNPEIITLVAGITAATAAFFPLLWLFSSFATPLGAIVVGTGALAAAFATDFGDIRQTVEKTVHQIFGDLSGLEDILATALAIIFPPEAAAMVADAGAAVFGEDAKTKIGASDLITIEAGDTLWGIWDENYRDVYSWEEFKEITGLGTTVLQPGDVIEIPTTFGQDFIDLFSGLLPEGWRDKLLGTPTVVALASVFHIDLTGSEETLETDLLTRLRTAFDKVADKIAPEMQKILTSVLAWFDDNVGAGLTGLARLFESGGATNGDTPLYRAIDTLLTGDVGGAINEVLPGFGTDVTNAVGGWGTAIGAAFPKIVTGLETLFGSIATWVLDTGIPMLTRTVGSIGGHLAAALYDAVGMAFTYFAGGGAGAGADAGVVAGYVKDNVLTPLQEGFNDGIAGSSLETEGIPAMQGMLDSLTAGLDTALSQLKTVMDASGITSLIESFGELGGGISDFVGDLAEADWSGVKELLGLAVSLAASVGMLAIAGFEGLVDGIASALPILGEGIKSIVNAIAMIGDKPIGDILTELGQGIINLSLGLLQIPMGVVDKVLELIESITDLELPDLTDLVDRLTTEINEAFDGIDPVVHLNDTTFTFDAASDPTVSNSAQITEDVAEVIRSYLLHHPPQVGDVPIEVSYVFAPTPYPTAEYGYQAPEFNPDEMQIVIKAGTPVTVDSSEVTGGGSFGTGLAIPPVTVSPTSLTMDFRGETTFTGLTSHAAELAEQVIPETELTDELAAHITTATTAAGTQLANAVIAGGVIDPNVFVENFLIPLDAAWTSYFGTDGTITKTTSDWITATSTGLGSLVTDFTELQTGVDVSMAAIVVTMTEDGDVLSGLFDEIKLDVDDLTLSFNALQLAAEAAGAAAVAGASGGEDPSTLPTNNRDGGLIGAGQSSWVGEEGAEIFVPHTAGSIIPSDVATGIARGGSSGEGNTYNTVTVNGAQDVDGLLYELRRRGVKVT